MIYKILIWLGLVLSVFFITIYQVSDAGIGGFTNCLHHPECGQVATLGICVISFPFGLLWILFLNVVGSLLDLGGAVEWFFASVVGCLFLGFIQWFIILPKVINFLKKHVRWEKKNPFSKS